MMPSPMLFAVSDLPVSELAFRLGAAALLALFIGIEREKPNRAAGMRTHVLVALGSAMFVLAAQNAGAHGDATSRVIQGVAQGIGFLGAGTILKLTHKAEVRGLTTAAGIWVTAGIGVASALGEFWIAIIATGIAWFALWPLRIAEEAIFPDDKNEQNRKSKRSAKSTASVQQTQDNEA